MSARHICIHGHFYQPPRENPWLEEVERQDSAFPHHDWNERVDAESYAPNAASRILDDEGRIVRIVNNYAKISFNFGPTLLAWMESRAPETYRAVLEADAAAADRFSGHGNAIAQAYGHMILPLANRRDKRTQIRWGIRDFRHRFRREPEGMWLPETAVDVESLDLMAEAGIRFTILAPHQAEAVRPAEGGGWTPVGEDDLDTTRPYRVPLPSGREIAVFFYDGAIARAVAFEDLLSSGDRFARRLLDAARADEDEPGLVHIATDGETYGHHHRHGEMALSYALGTIEDAPDATLTNYGEYLDAHPPEREARIAEETSWSCAHGIERWRSDCGCSGGREPTWHQRWRRPLREALDGLRDRVGPLYEEAARALFDDPWEARDRYVDVVLDRSPDRVASYLEDVASAPLRGDDRVRALELLELQRHAMLMYTSCGWFFDDLGGIETVQVLRYAGRVVQLAERLFGEDAPEPGIEEGFLRELEDARSNDPATGSGREIYRRRVEPSMVDLPKVAAHYAVSSLFEPYGEESEVYCYAVDAVEEERHESGRAALVLGRVRVESRITLEEEELSHAVLHLGDHNVVGGVRVARGEEAYDTLRAGLETHFSRADFPAVIRLLDRRFRASTYSLRSLFRDEQRRILDRILGASVTEAEEAFADIYEDRAPLLRFVAELGIPQPRPFRMAAEFVLNTRLERALSSRPPDLDRARSVLEAAREEGVQLDSVAIEYAARGMLESLADAVARSPEELEGLRTLQEALGFVAHHLPFPVNRWRVENTFYSLARDVYPGVAEEAERENGSAREWVGRFERIGEMLGVRTP